MSSWKSSADLAILNARILVDQKILDGGIAIKNGKIMAVGRQESLPKASETIDAENGIVIPGLIDIHTHLRDLKLDYKEDFYSGTCAALAGGFTTVFDMPNTLPTTNNSMRLREKIETAKSKIVANVGFYSCFPRDENEVIRIANEGAVGFKVFLNHSNLELNVEDNALIPMLNKAREAKKIVAVHAEDRFIIEEATKKSKNAGNDSYDAFFTVHPARAEIKAVKKMISLSRATRIHIHFCHVTTLKALSLITEAKAEGLKITCEVTPHHMLLTRNNPNGLNGTLITDPPLRSRMITMSFRHALGEEGIDVVASDHAPHSINEKSAKSIWNVSPGIPGLETTLPLLLTMVKRGRLSLSRLVELLAKKPAEIFGLDGKGAIKKGFDADLTIIDFREAHISSSAFHSKAKYSPFDGWKVDGKAVKTFVGGRLVMDEGEILAKPGSGHVLHL
ncbi:MAG: dihydroorotase [Thermoproteota archaeon]|nr:dihydroorotase [Thermoproteota archaeon]